ncbi:MAG: NADH-ubiquinone oxidoreductase-F iron-sulfur binding region domain-containing protein [Candidatus Entotheonellia bacterium]
MTVRASIGEQPVACTAQIWHDKGQRSQIKVHSLEKALGLASHEILDAIEASGLRGRGGAGFPTGRKWRAVALESHTPKYVVCNADESEPCVFKDGVLIDTNPHQILDRLFAGERDPGQNAALDDLAHVLEQASFCGLGQSAAWPLRSALRHFGAAFRA